MKTPILPLVFSFCFFSFTINAQQSCLPDGITFNTQEQIDSFAVDYPGCTEIEGSVHLIGPDISNLQGLNPLTTIQGDLIVGGYSVISDGTGLSNFLGLENLTSIGGNLHVENNPALSNFSGLENLESVGVLNPSDNSDGLYLSHNQSLTSLSALESLTQLNALQIIQNSSLVSLEGLEQIDSLPGCLIITADNGLSNLNGLDGLEYIGECTNVFVANYILPTSIGMFVGWNVTWYGQALENLEGLENLKHIEGNVLFVENFGLTSLNGLNNLESIGGSLYLGITSYDSYGYLISLGNYDLQDLQGLESLTTIGDGLYVVGNSSLYDLEGLNNLESVSSVDPSAGVSILSNTNLHNLDGLEKLDSIPGTLQIGAGFFYQEWQGNPKLNDLGGISNLKYLGRLNVYSNESLLNLNDLNDTLHIENYVAIAQNQALSVCHNRPICRYLDENEDLLVIGNAEGCNSLEQIEVGCETVSTENISHFERIQVFPNPTEGLIFIEGLDPEAWQLRISNSAGRQIQDYVPLSGDQVDLSASPPGMYILEFRNGSSSFVRRVFRM